MSRIANGKARAVADLAAGLVVATVEIAASPERVFQALASKDIVDWWLRAGVFNTTEWTGDARAGGRWQASGIARGQPYVVEGEFLEVDPPRKLVHTWKRRGAPDPATTVTYLLEPVDGGTRITLRHSGFTSGEACKNVGAGWETSFYQLAAFLASQRSPSDR
jgi:uncharacterized protein YndB with AHSA1/START domain